PRPVPCGTRPAVAAPNVNAVAAVTTASEPKTILIGRRISRSAANVVLRFRLIADLQIPAVRIAHVEALERRRCNIAAAAGVLSRRQTPLRQLLAHDLCVPRIDAPRNMINYAGNRWP